MVSKYTTGPKMLPLYTNSYILCILLPQKVKYKEKFDKEMKGKRPQYDLKESKIYKTLKDANDLASEVSAHIICSMSHSTLKL